MPKDDKKKRTFWKFDFSIGEDIVKTLPVGICSAGAHSSSVFALGGDPLFGQIVKAAEPVVSAVVNTVAYGKPPSMAKWMCLPIIVGGVAFASMKKGEDGNYALKFDSTALIFGMIANFFAAFKGSENKKLMSAPGIKDRFGSVGNQFAVTEILAFLVSLPVMFYTEGHVFGEFCDLFMNEKQITVEKKNEKGSMVKENVTIGGADFRFNLIMSGLTFYLYNELATMTIKKTGAVTSSVANTAKRVIVMVYMAAVTGKALTEEQKIGAGIAIGGVMLYSVIDDFLKGKEPEKEGKKAEVKKEVKSDNPGLLGENVALLLFFVFWYAGNIKYNEYNKGALDGVGGKKAGMTMTVSTMQLGVCSMYALLLWLFKLNPINICGLQMPGKQPIPKISSLSFFSKVEKED